MIKRKTILIVEDNPFNLDMFVSILSNEYQVRVATDGESALKTALKLIPDLILLDVKIPKMDGFEVCGTLKANSVTKDIPVIFLTSLSDAEDEEKGLAVGGADYIIKPFNPALMLARIKNHLELKAHREQLDALVKERTEELEKTKEALIASMAILAESRDHDTGSHIYRTKRMIRILAEELAVDYPSYLSKDVIEQIEQSAPLHDIGKVGIPDSILLKKGPLTPEEWEIMKQHTQIGAEIIHKTERILGGSSFLSLAKDIVEFHHEKWDGSGYPHGLSGEAIPLSAQLVSIADVYDALVSDRPYKKAFSHEQAVEILLNGDDRLRPGSFSPKLLQAFLRCEKKLKKLYFPEPALASFFGQTENGLKQ